MRKGKKLLGALAFLFLVVFVFQSQDQPAWKQKAQKMVKEQIEERGIDNEKLLKVMRNTPRHQFVPEKYKKWAYDDRPLPIGHDQTISQPYIVALMTDLLQIKKDDKILEIGTGSGYQAAILAGLADQVYTIEIVEALANQAKKRLKQMGFSNIQVRHGNGYNGWPEHAPFDKIIVTAAPKKIPEALKNQLKKGGRMVLPVGDHFQQLKIVQKTKNGAIKEKNVTGVRFVPMVNPGKDE